MKASQAFGRCVDLLRIAGCACYSLTGQGYIYHCENELVNTNHPSKKAHPRLQMRPKRHYTCPALTASKSSSISLEGAAVHRDTTTITMAETMKAGSSS